jgi:hypothetical protein
MTQAVEKISDIERKVKGKIQFMFISFKLMINTNSNKLYPINLWNLFIKYSSVMI